MTSETSHPGPTMTIGGTPIGGPHPPYIIAEAGVNHAGDIQAAHALIDVAHRAGANAVKFQVFSAKSLVSTSAPACAYQTQHDPQATTQFEMLQRLELPTAALRELKAHADQISLHFLATPFGVAEVAAIAALGVPAIKTASTDLVNYPLLDAAAATGIPLIVSTGAATLEEIRDGVARIRQRSKAAGPILLHCVSAYPTPPDQANLACIGELVRTFGLVVGFSDHTCETHFGALAVAAGARVLEKHITLDRSLPGPDQFFSLEPESFVQYVQAAHDARVALGDGVIGVSPAEEETRRLARGQLVTAVSIHAGQALTTETLKVQRPGEGISPANWDAVLGRVAKADIPADTPLGWGMLQE